MKLLVLLITIVLVLRASVRSGSHESITIPEEPTKQKVIEVHRSLSRNEQIVVASNLVSKTGCASLLGMAFWTLHQYGIHTALTDFKGSEAALTLGYIAAAICTLGLLWN